MFKKIPGYSGKYIVNELGEFYSSTDYHGGSYGELKRKTVYVNKRRWGYNYIHLQDGKKKKNCLVHRVIAEVFIPNPHNLPEINHKDGNKSNNSVENLEWCTPKENRQHQMKILGYKMDHGRKDLHQYSTDGFFIRTFNSTSHAQKVLGVKCINFKYNGFSHGFLWSRKKLDFMCYKVVGRGKDKYKRIRRKKI